MSNAASGATYREDLTMTSYYVTTTESANFDGEQSTSIPLDLATAHSAARNAIKLGSVRAIIRDDEGELIASYTYEDKAAQDRLLADLDPNA